MNMTNEKFLQMIFNGYVTCYRKNNWHTTAKYHDMTHRELQFFMQLGESLGFIVRREMEWQYPRDLCWCETHESIKPFLYLERENLDNRAEHTINKMLNPDNSKDIPILVCVFGWIRPNTLDKMKSLIRQSHLVDQSFLIVSWVGEDKDTVNDVEGWSLCDGQEAVRTAKAETDDAGYWYIKFNNSWFIVQQKVLAR